MANLFSHEAPLLEDAELVARCQAGDTTAYAQIVARYQGLICALTYSATGNVHQSEDLAQDTFLAAWKNLANLREPTKLRSWLCGIARNLSLNRHRDSRREPTHAAETLENFEMAKDEPGPDALAMSQDEATLVWRALEEVPETYREPLVLFYRQNQSVENVAQALELSEDAVRQRLTRGRNLLNEKVEKMIEGTLAKTNPGRAFTTSVMAALPIGAMSAGKAAALSATAAKGATALKATGMGAGAMIFGPVMGVLSGWLGIKYSVENSRSIEEREVKLKAGRAVLALVVAVLLGQFAIFTWCRFFPLSGIVIASLMILLWGGYTVGLLAIFWHSQTEHKKIRRAQNQPTVDPAVRDWYEYRSAWTLLGLPLVHVNSGMTPDGSARIAKGWLAIGGIAVGVVAIGGVSFGLVSFGGLAVGVIALAGVAGGPIAIGGVAIGGWVVGGLAIGYEAIGGVAVAWQGADGGVAIAREFASGRSARAVHANDDAVKVFQNTNAFFREKETFLSGFMILGWLMIPLLGWQVIRLWRRKKTAGHRPMTMGELFGRRS